MSKLFEREKIRLGEDEIGCVYPGMVNIRCPYNRNHVNDVMLKRSAQVGGKQEKCDMNRSDGQSDRGQDHALYMGATCKSLFFLPDDIYMYSLSMCMSFSLLN